jgi:prophage antirepressor-like protein
MELTPFDFSGNTIRIITDENGDPWWVASDVFAAVGLKNPNEAVRSLDDDEKATIRITEGDPERIIVNESGLHHLLQKAQKPAAKRFRRWITQDILPIIRKTGSYSIQHQPPQTSTDALREFTFEVGEYEVLKPTPDVADQIAAWTGQFSVRDCANILQIGPHTFSASIVRDKYCCRRLGKIVPYAQYEQLGWFSRDLVRASGKSGHTYRQTSITPLGVYRFMEIYNPHKPPTSAFLIAKRKHQRDFKTVIDSTINGENEKSPGKTTTIKS